MGGCVLVDGMEAGDGCSVVVEYVPSTVVTISKITQSYEHIALVLHSLQMIYAMLTRQFLFHLYVIIYFIMHFRLLIATCLLRWLLDKNISVKRNIQCNYSRMRSCLATATFVVRL